MRHTGYVFLAKAKPVAETTEDGTFRLTLCVMDDVGHGRREGYRVRWEGPEARAFWQRHQHDLQPGAVLDAQLENVRIHMGANFNARPELHARVITLTYCPRVTTPQHQHATAQCGRASFATT